MTPAARVQSTLDLLSAIAEATRPADAIISAYFRARRFIGSHDRSALSSRIYTILRHHARLVWWLDKFNFSIEPRSELLAWLVLGEKMPTKDVAALCSGGKYALSSLKEDERTFLNKISGGTIEHPNMPEHVIAECPEEFYQALKTRFGKLFMREMRAMQEAAPLDLRVNTLKTTRDKVYKKLIDLGFKVEMCALSPLGLRIYDRPSLSAVPMLKNGEIEIQDEGSQMIAFVVDAKPGERVVDFCAGAGGKTLAIGASMENKGRITACDTLSGRLKPSTERFRRAGLHNVETRVLTSERDPWVKKHKGTFDCVLTDVPCSGIGTWRRHPDARWHRLGPKLTALIPLQTEILDSASRLVKPGGRVIYSTCSLLANENEEQIEKFLALHPDFERVDCGLMGAPYLILSPGENGTDGFFAAVMAKKTSPD